MGPVGSGLILLWICLATGVQAAFRLPDTLTPTHYDLQLVPSNSTYTGNVQITFQTSTNATGDALMSVSLHKDSSVFVNYTQVTLQSNTSVTLAITNSTYEADTQVYTLVLQTAMTAGATYILTIPFSGTLRTDSTGFHIGTFTNNNTTSYYIATNFYPIYARLAFPCFDEPQFKSTFAVSVVRSSSQFALSNQNLENSTTVSGGIQDVFNSTPAMSVHSLSIFIADNSSVDTQQTTVDTGTALTLITPKDVTATVFLISTLSNFQSKLEQLIQVTHPLEHLSFVILPDSQYDVFGGFGIIFMKQDVAYPYTINSIQRTVDIYLITLGEMVKQYVCHYLTPAWWSDIWFTQGLGMYLEYMVFSFVVDKSQQINPDQLMAVNIRQKALSLDTEESGGYPLVETDITTTARILRAVSDDMKKYKGMAVFYMMQQSYSGTPIKTLIKTFFANNGFSTITTSQFLEQISVNDTNFMGMDSWFTTIGYPTVTLSRSGYNFSLTQNKISGLTNTNLTSTSWRIPVTYTSSSKPFTEWQETSAMYWFNANSSSVTSNVNTSEWIIFNLKSTGFYRVQYSTDDLQLIQNQLKTNSYRIDTINHAAIVDDLMALAATGSYDYETALYFLQNTSSYARYSPWVSTINALNFLKLSLYDQPGYDNFKAYVQNLLLNVYTSVGFTGTTTETKNVTFLRDLILPWACEFEIGDCLNNSATILNTVLNALQSNNTKAYFNLDQNMCDAFKNITTEQFQIFFTFYKNNHNKDNFQYYIASGLGCVKNTYLETILTSLLNGDIYPEDVDQVFSRTYSVIENVDTVLSFIVDNATSIQQKYGTQFLLKLIKGIGSQLYSETQLTKLSSLNSTTTDVLSTITSVTTVVQQRISWATQYNATLSTVFNKIITKSSAITVTQSFVLLLLTLLISFSKFM